MYRGNRPNGPARVSNMLAARLFSRRRDVALQVRRFTSGAMVSVPVVIGARPHFPISRHAPVDEFESIAARLPVVRIDPDAPGAPDGTGR